MTHHRSPLRWFAAAFLTCAIAAPSGIDRASVDWHKLAPETLEHYSALLRINSSNPPGNETRVASYLKQILEREGIATKLFSAEPDRANLVARLKGNGKKRPILLLAHTDVVGVQREKWTVDPFAAVRKDGYVYGRGAIDDKDKLVACLMVMLQLKRSHTKLDRDVIFLAEAGEEATPAIGIEYMIRDHWPEIDAEYAISEGGGGFSVKGQTQYVTISTTEKVPRRAKLVAHGTAGHGSVPRVDNAVIRLANAIAKLGEWQPPMRMNDTTRTYFERLAMISPREEADRYNHIADSSRTAEIQAYLAEHEPEMNSVLRTTISPTMLRAGIKENVIPSEADATLDIRVVPGDNVEQVYEWIRGLIADSNVDLVPLKGTRPFAPASSIDTEMFRAFEAAQRRLYPGAVTLPCMQTGATDLSELRAHGVQAYGIGPVVDEKDRGSSAGHSDDERLSEESLYGMVEFLWHSVYVVAASK